VQHADGRERVFESLLLRDFIFCADDTGAAVDITIPG
jgi:hypothetical protein